MARSILEIRPMYGEKAKTMDILGTIAALDLKVARCRQLTESMMVCVIYYSQGRFLILTQGHLNIKIKIMVFSEITGPMKVKSLCWG